MHYTGSKEFKKCEIASQKIAINAKNVNLSMYFGFMGNVYSGKIHTLFCLSWTRHGTRIHDTLIAGEIAKSDLEWRKIHHGRRPMEMKQALFLRCNQLCWTLTQSEDVTFLEPGLAHTFRMSTRSHTPAQTTTYFDL